MKMSGKICMPGVLAVTLVVATPSVALSQLDRSCNALQMVQQQTRVNRLPPEDRQRFQGVIAGYEREINQLFDGSRAKEKAFNGEIQRQRDALLGGRSAPTDPKAQAELNAKVWASCQTDAKCAQAAAAILREQTGPYHDLERRQYGSLLKISEDKATYDRKINEATSAVVAQQPQLTERVLASRPVQELLATVAAGDAAARASLSQEKITFAVSQSRLVFEVPADPVVGATEALRSAMRGVESLRLSRNLDFQAVSSFTPAPRDRSSAMRNSESELSRAVAESVGAALQKSTLVGEGSRRLRTIEVPPPPPAATSGPPEPSKVQQWVQGVAEQAQKAAKKVQIILEEGPPQ